MDYSVRQVGEWPLETTIIHEERYTRGMSGVMMSLSESMPKMPPPLGRKRKTSKGAGKYPAVENFARHSGNSAHDAAAAAGRRGKQGVKERENPLRWRISLGTRWKMPKMPPPPGRRGTRRDAAAGEEETRDSGARKYIAVEDLAPLLSGLP